MATINHHGAAQAKQPKPMPPDPSCQPCPDCGGLECLCRPRFFAGQLLSEQDLNRLDRYIVEKHKLHNRHLFGSGVVCGLEVKCAPCDSGLVTVSAGYALSPCGEDIVVCKQDTVDICALIARCRQDEEPDCAPYSAQETCGEVIEDWILAIRYAESPSRGVTALTGAGQGCGCSCAGPCTGKCGGGTSCGCGGGAACSCGAAQGLAEPEPLRQPRLNRGAPPSCEPTLTCETYRYDVFRAPEKEDPRGEQNGLAGVFNQLEGDLMARIACCLKEIQALIPAAPGDINQPIPDNQRQAWFKWGCQVRTAIANYFVRVGGYDCEAIAKLQAVVIPSPAQPAGAFQLAMQGAMIQLAVLLFEAIIACFCSAALPPCPAPGDPRVPLAAVRVRRGDCHVVSVCNWTLLRKHVLTFPTLEYWFGFIPIIRVLREVMHNLCCDLLGLAQEFEPPEQPGMESPDFAPEAAAHGEEEAGPLQTPVTLDLLAASRFDTNLMAAIVMRQDTGGTQPTLGDVARAAFERPNVAIEPGLDPEARKAAIRRVAQTAPAGLLAGVFAGAAPLVALGRRIGAGTAPQPDVAELKAEVARQGEEIRALQAAVTVSRSGISEGGRKSPDTSEGGRKSPDSSRGGRKSPDSSRGGRKSPDTSEGGRKSPDSSRGGSKSPGTSRGGRKSPGTSRGGRKS